MTFDPMKFYDDGQRRQKRYDSLVPVFVVAIVLLVVFGAAFVAYQRSHVKPKPVAPALVLPKPMHDTEVTCSGSWDASDEGCNTWRNQTTVTQSSTTWYRCSDGVTVTGDLKNCPEYAGSGGTKNLDVGHESFTKDEFAYSKKKPRKHKRKAVCVAVNEYVDGLGDSDFWMIPGTMIWFPTHRECNKFWANPIPLWAGAHPIVWNKSDCLPGGCDHILQMVIRNNEDLVRTEKNPDCLPGGSVKGDIPPCTDMGYGDNTIPTEKQINGGGPCGEAICDWPDHPERVRSATTPQDITNLMEQIAPTSKDWKAAEYDQLALDHSQDFYDNVFVPSMECTDRERYRQLQCQMDGTCLMRNLDSKNWCPVVEWHINPPAAPDCKMPADVDVCPAQALDPKVVSDKKVKP